MTTINAEMHTHVGIDGYMAGVRDARMNRTPEHSQTHYSFPKTASIDGNKSLD